jgi:hypothetical protein
VRNTSTLVQVILIIQFQAFLLFSQVSNRTGALGGMVTDPQGAPVQGARVTATSADTNQRREITANERGEFLFANLPAGPWSMTVEAAGFAGKEFAEIIVGAGQTLYQKVDLKLSSVSEKMEVVEESPVLDTSATSASVSFGYERMEHSSAQGRNYVNFVLTAPGMAPAQGQTTGRSPAATWNANNDSGFVSNGIRSRNNSVSIDGTDNRDETTGAIRVSVPLEMVQELRIAGTTVSADLGGAAGGVVNIVTRSGSNKLHGHGEFLFQNEALNARNPEFAISGRPRMRRWQPGASASGPVVKDKTFFAAAFETYIENCDEWSEGFAAFRNPFAFRAGERNYQYSGKVQHLFNNVHSGTLRYAYSLGKVRNGVQGIDNHSDVTSRGSSRVADHGVVGTLSSAFSPTLLNSLTFQYASRGFNLTPNSFDPFVEIPGVLSFGQSPKLNQQRTEEHIEVVNGMTWIRGRNTVSFGASVHRVNFEGSLANRFNGVTVYPTLAAYLAGRPDFSLRAMGNPATSFSTTPVGMWLNDRWQVRRGLTIEAGLRYDYQFLPGGISSPRTNIAPRFGIAWNPGGESRTVFRLGTGLFFDRYPLAYLNEAIQKNGVNAYEQFTYPGLAPFQASYRFSSQMPATYGAKFTAGVERKLNADTTIAAEYSRVRGVHLPRIRNAAGTLPATFLLEQNASSSYNGMTLTLSRKMTSEFGYLVSYTGGRTYDDGSDYEEQAQNPLNLRQEWARSRQHQAHRVTATALFEIEALEKLSEKLEHIHIVPTFTFGSGRPLPALETSDVYRTGAFPISARAAGMARNPFYTAPNASLDARVFKEIHWDDKPMRLQVGIEGYNLLNRSNPVRMLPYYAAGGNKLGNYRETIEFSPARQLQLFMHFEF